jgi:hypothetical protein
LAIGELLSQANTAFTWALNPQIDFSLLIEQWFVNRTRARFFLRTPQRKPQKAFAVLKILDSRFHACVPKRLYFGVQARE